LLFFSCSPAPHSPLPTSQSPFATFRDIPGITAEEIQAIEALQQKYESFIYGMTVSTEAFLTDNGVGGYTALFCEWLSGLFGIEFQPAIYSWMDLMAGLESGQVDFTGELTPTEERLKMYYMTDPIAERQYKTIQLEGSPALDRIAIERPPRYAFVINAANEAAVASVTEPGSYEPVWVRNFAEIIAALENGDADAFVGDGAVMATFDAYGGMYTEDFFPPIFTSVSMSAANPDLLPIISVVNKALTNGALPYLSRLYNQGYHDYMKYKLLMLLDYEEYEYISSHPVIPIVANYNNYPVCFYNTREKGWQGIFFDLMDEVSALTGLSFDLIHDEKAEWPVIYEKLRTGEAALSASLLWTKEREDHFIWSKTALPPDYYALLSKSDYPDIRINEIKHTKIGLGGADTAAVFRQWFSEHTNTIEYGSINDALNALLRGEVDMVFATQRRLLLLTHYLESPGYKANIIFSQPIETTFGYNKDEIVLRSIIDKALQIIDTNGINERWIHKTYDYRAKVTEARMPWLIGAIILSLTVLSLLLVLLYRSHIERKNLVKEEAEAKVREADERAQIIFNTAPLASCMIDKEGQLVDCNQEVVKMFGIPDKEFFLKSFFSLLFPKYQPDGAFSTEVSANNLRTALENGYHHFECMHQKLNGEPLPSDITLVRVKYKGNDMVAA
jgi:ABC-type amino acid transport substrate-binding protein